MAYIGSRLSIFTLVAGTLGAPVLADPALPPETVASAQTAVPLLLDHQHDKAPVAAAREAGLLSPAAVARQGGEPVPQRKPEFMFGDAGDWEFGIGSRRAVGLMLRRSFD